MVSRYPQTRPSLGGLDQTKTKSDQTIPITGQVLLLCGALAPLGLLMFITSIPQRAFLSSSGACDPDGSFRPDRTFYTDSGFSTPYGPTGKNFDAWSHSGLFQITLGFEWSCVGGNCVLGLWSTKRLLRLLYASWREQPLPMTPSGPSISNQHQFSQFIEFLETSSKLRVFDLDLRWF
jgi:hypothetical protein